MIRLYLWLSQMLLATLIAAVGAKMATSYMSAKLLAPVAAKPPQDEVVLKPQGKRTFANYQVIFKRNIFNANPISKKPTPKPPPVAQPTQLRLILAGTATKAESLRYAVIEDHSQKGSQDVYRVGDVIQKATIVEIRRDCVLLDWNGQYQSLCFPSNAEEEQANPYGLAASSPSAFSSLSSAPPAGSTANGRVDNTTCEVRRERFLEQFVSFQALSTWAKFLPYRAQGKLSGFLLTRTKRGSLLRKIGMRNGDILHKVNGLNIASPSEGPEVFQQLRNVSTVQMEVLRRNRAIALTCELH